MFETKFKGTGSFQQFVNDVVKLFSSINASKIIMPTGHSGADPSIRFEKDQTEASLVLDFSGSDVFSLANISWDVGRTSGATIKRASVENGVLKIYVRVNSGG